MRNNNYNIEIKIYTKKHRISQAKVQPPEISSNDITGYQKNIRTNESDYPKSRVELRPFKHGFKN